LRALWLIQRSREKESSPAKGESSASLAVGADTGHMFLHANVRLGVK
jgi:hypothetical protein